MWMINFLLNENIYIRIGHKTIIKRHEKYVDHPIDVPLKLADQSAKCFWYVPIEVAALQVFSYM